MLSLQITLPIQFDINEHETVMSSSTKQLLCNILPVDVVTIVDEMLNHHAAHHFYCHQNSCICCGIHTKKSNTVSQFLHTDVQLYFSCLMRQIIYTYTSLPIKLVAHSDVRSALRAIHGEVTLDYYNYLDNTHTGWMLCSSGVDGHMAVACSSNCLRRMQQYTQLICSKNPIGVWVPFTEVYVAASVRYHVHDYISHNRVATIQQRKRVALLVSETRLWHRLMLKHSRRLAYYHRIAIVGRDCWRLACILCQQFTLQSKEIPNMMNHILSKHQNNSSLTLALTGLFHKHDTILTRVDRCYWES